MLKESRGPPRRAGPAAAALLVVLAGLTALAPQAAAHGGAPEIFSATGAVYSVAWNKAGTLLAASASNGNITLIDGVYHVEIKHWHAAEGPINEIVWSPDGGKIAAASGAYKVPGLEQTLKVWDIIGPTLLLNITGHYDWVTSVAWSPDGTMLASASGVDDHSGDPNATIFGQVMFWDARSGALLWNASPLDSYPARIAWAPDGHAVAAVGHLNDIWLLDPYSTPKSMERINHTYHDPVGHASHGWGVGWSPDSRYIVGGFSYDYTLDGATDEGPVIVFDPLSLDKDGYARQIWRADIHSRPAEWVGWDSSGKYIASCSGADLLNATGPTPVPGTDGVVDAGEVVVYNFSNSTPGLLKAENVFIFGHNWCSAVAWRPGNLTIAAGNADGSVKIYILDEDGDGCLIWNDAAPLDPTICAAPAAPANLSFIDAWGLPLVGVAAVAVLAAGGFFVWRSGVRAEPVRNGRRPRSSSRTGGKGPPPRRR